MSLSDSKAAGRPTLTTMVFPQATAEATFTIHMSNGPFQGMMAPQTPWRETAVVSALLSGSRSMMVMPVCKRKMLCRSANAQ